MAATEGYHTNTQGKPPSTRRYRGISRVRPIDAAKEKVPCIDLADLLLGSSGLRRRGAEWVGRCPLPDHEDKNPSFTVNPEKNLWFCHGCVRGGDCVELARCAWGYDQRDAHTAAAMLLMEFGHEVPQRPTAWFRKQERQKGARELMEDARTEALTRRMWKYVFAPMVSTIEDEAERAEMARSLLPEVRRQARYMLEDGHSVKKEDSP
jgi:hypothetical protein